MISRLRVNQQFKRTMIELRNWIEGPARPVATAIELGLMIKLTEASLAAPQGAAAEAGRARLWQLSCECLQCQCHTGAPNATHRSHHTVMGHESSGRPADESVTRQGRPRRRLGSGPGITVP